MAEAVGFEPTEPLGSTVFKTAAFNHSATPPRFITFSQFNLADENCCSTVFGLVKARGLEMLRISPFR